MEVAEPVCVRVVVVVAEVVPVVVGVAPVVVVSLGGAVVGTSVVGGAEVVVSVGAGWPAGPPTLSVWVRIGCPPLVCVLVGTAPGCGVAETADVELVVDIVVTRACVPVRVARAVDCVDEAVAPPWAATLLKVLNVLTVPDRVAMAVGRLAAGDDRRGPGSRKAPSAAAVDAPAVSTPTAAAELIANRDRRSSNHRRFGVLAGRVDRRFIGCGGSRRTGGSGGYRPSCARPSA